MTKIEIINEIKNVVMNNGGNLNLGWVLLTFRDGELVRFTNGCPKKVKYETVAQIKAYLDFYNEYVAKKAKTVETEVENDTEYVAETKATKKDIIMGLHKNDEVKCDLATAEALATEGFIYIRNYEDGVLYGEVEYDAVCEDLIDEDDLELFDEVRDGEFGYHDIDQVTEWYDMGYLKQIEYGGDGKWYCDMDWNGVLDDFCKRWDNKLNEAA